MRHLCLLFVAAASIQFAYGQNDWKTAEKYFGSFQYASAAKIYEKMLSANSGNKAATERLVACYDKLNDPEKSEPILSALCASDGIDPAYFKMYADVLAENAKYDQATEWYNKYLSITADDNAKKTVSGYTRLPEFYRDSIFYYVEKASFNSEGADFSPTYYKNGVVFCSSRGSGKGTYLWDNSAFIDLYVSADAVSAPVAMEKAINTSFHEGPATFTPGFDTIFFTRNNFINSKKANSKEGVMKLKIFYAVMTNGKWGKAKNITLNNDEYSVGHPVLSPDHKLYFASDMPSGLGGTDIYYSKLENGKWIAPVNLGAPINTPGNEMFPFINSNGDLFFASSGHAGLGGLDVFQCIYYNEKFYAPSNLGYPVNSSRDDFGLITSGGAGYFSSNRGKNSKDDNIYAYRIKKDFAIVIQVVNKGGVQLEDYTVSLTNAADEKDQVKDQQVQKNFERNVNAEGEYRITLTKDGYQQKEEKLSKEMLFKIMAAQKPLQVTLYEAVAMGKVDLVNEGGQRLMGGTVLITNLTSKETKKYIVENDVLSVELATGTEYELSGQQTGFKTKTQLVNSGMLNLTGTVVVTLAPSETLFEKNELGQIIELDIKYDLGKATIRPDAANELDKLVEFMKKNPSVKVELGSHTDIRGSEEDNLKLSQRRAESAVRHIVTKGISSRRLIPMGYGENDLKIQEAANEEEHQLNRRTTVKIVGI